MYNYQVELTYRPNANQAGRIVRRIRIQAPNKEAATVLAGNKIGLGAITGKPEGMVPSSLEVKVQRVGKA